MFRRLEVGWLVQPGFSCEIYFALLDIVGLDVGVMPSYVSLLYCSSWSWWRRDSTCCCREWRRVFFFQRLKRTRPANARINHSCRVGGRVEDGRMLCLGG